MSWYNIMMYLSRSYMYNTCFSWSFLQAPRKKNTYFATFTIDPSQTSSNIVIHCKSSSHLLRCFLLKQQRWNIKFILHHPSLSKATDFFGSTKIWTFKNFAIPGGPPGSWSSGTSRVVSLESLGRIGWFHPALSLSVGAIGGENGGLTGLPEWKTPMGTK